MLQLKQLLQLLLIAQGTLKSGKPGEFFFYESKFFLPGAVVHKDIVQVPFIFFFYLASVFQLTHNQTSLNSKYIVIIACLSKN